jgi:hypothetical protein
MRYRRPGFVNIGLLFFCALISSSPMAAEPNGGSDLRGTPRQLQVDPAQSGSATTASSINARMEQVIQSYVSNRMFMGSVLVARGNIMLLDKGYGFANLEWDTANSRNQSFAWAAVARSLHR